MVQNSLVTDPYVKAAKVRRSFGFNRTSKQITYTMNYCETWYKTNTLFVCKTKCIIVLSFEPELEYERIFQYLTFTSTIYFFAKIDFDFKIDYKINLWIELS